MIIHEFYVILFIQMSKFQQTLSSNSIRSEKDQTSTQADSYTEQQKSTLQTVLANTLPQIQKTVNQQHIIVAKVSSNIFSADKILKLVSNVLKVLRTYNLTHHIKSLQMLGSQIGQIRRLLRVDRLFIIIKEFIGFYNKKHLTTTQKWMILFKMMLLFEDANDLGAYLIQMKVIKGDHLINDIRKRVASLYFLECMGWLAYHCSQYFKAKNQQQKYRNKMAIVKYILDGLVAHNDFGHKLFTIESKLSTIISLVSASLNLYLVWK